MLRFQAKTDTCGQGLSFGHLFIKFFISLMASDLKRANQIFRTSVNT